jgi:hypothetical protein
MVLGENAQLCAQKVQTFIFTHKKYNYPDSEVFSALFEGLFLNLYLKKSSQIDRFVWEKPNFSFSSANFHFRRSENQLCALILTLKLINIF